jgi:hypothetical protein
VACGDLTNEELAVLAPFLAAQPVQGRRWGDHSSARCQGRKKELGIAETQAREGTLLAPRCLLDGAKTFRIGYLRTKANCADPAVHAC